MSENRERERPEPSVGNILGFALLFRDRRALLTLEGRALAPGVTLDTYEADLSGIIFPVSGSLAPGRFRHHRCDAGHVRLSVEWWAVSDWLTNRLQGRNLDALHVDRVTMLSRSRITATSPPGPVLVVEGRVGTEPAWLAAPLRLRPRGHGLAIAPAALWLLAPQEIEPETIWNAMASYLGPAMRPAGGRTYLLDPVRLAVARTFAAAGWKAPRADSLTLAELEASQHGLSLSLQRDATVAPAWPDLADAGLDRVHTELERARAALVEGSFATAWDVAEQLLDEVAHDRGLASSLGWWLYTHARFRDRDRATRGARAWAHAAPSDAAAQRALTVVLAANDDADELARALTRQLRLPHPPVALARLELGLGLLMVDRLGDATGGLTLLDPLVDRARSESKLEAILPEALGALARARAAASPGSPARALAALEEALELREDPSFRGNALARAAAAFQAADETAIAHELIIRACREDPSDPGLLDQAIELVAAIGDDAAAIDLLEQRAKQVDPATAAILQRRLADLLQADGRPTAADRALRHVEAALEAEPDAPDLLRRAARLHGQRDRPEQAIPYLRQLLEIELDPANLAEHRLQLATALRDRGDRDEAWATLSVIAQAGDALPRRVAELALALAPAEERDRLVDRLSPADAALGANALMERAARQTSRERRLDDLRRAAALLEDPIPALQAITEAAESSDPQPFLELALALTERDDLEGEMGARLEAGLRQLGAADLARASASLERAAARASNPAVWLALCAAHLRAGQREEAAAAATRLLELGLDNVDPAIREDPRLGLPTGPGALELRLAELLDDGDDREPVVSLLRAAHKQARPGSEISQTASESLVDVLTGLGRRDEALDVALTLAETLGGEARGELLVRAAALADPDRAASLLAHAAELGVTDPRALEAHERALREAGDWAALESLLSKRLSDEHDPTARGQRLERIIDVVRQHGQESGQGDRSSDLIDLYDQLLSVRSGDVDAALSLASLYDARGDEDRALGQWERALRNMPAGDARSFAPAMRVAVRAADDERPDEAQPPLERALAVRPGDRGALELLARIARDLDDADSARRAAEGLLPQAGTNDERALRSIDLARAEARLGQVAPALHQLEQAASWVQSGSAIHVELAECWLELAALVEPNPHARPRMQHEARARAEMRKALRRGQDPLDVRAEARLLLELDRDGEALVVLRTGLETHPTHDLLLSALKELVTVVGDPTPYLDILDTTIEREPPGEIRDRLATELAFTAMEHQDASRVLEALDRLSEDRGAAPELMDLRDWAIRALGREDQEMQAVETRLLAAPTDAALHTRLRRIVGDAGAYVDRLLDLSERVDDDVSAQRIVEVALEQACERARDPTSLLRTVRAANRVEAISVLLERWSQIERLVLASHDEGAIADLIMEADEAARSGYGSIAAHADKLLDRAIALMPGSTYLHRALWSRLRGPNEGPDERAAAAESILDELVARHGLTGQRLASLYTAHTELLDRRRGAGLLRARAEAYMDDKAVFGALLSALEHRNHWPEVLGLLEQRAAACQDPAERVGVLKHLAHVCGDVLDDPATAILHLEAALDNAPTDPDLLLALLDLHYSRTDLQRAVELTIRVLDHVPMGDDAFSALAHRATDAAVARNDLELARELLERVLKRRPDDTRGRTRLSEVEAMSDDPEHRVRMLEGIASRHGGSSRIEALEERARLLVDPLERIEEAIDDLRAVVSEAPERRASAIILADLLEHRGRWSELVSTLESQFPRLQGAERSTTLARVAGIYRSHLYDLPRAEQALRLALENLGPTPSDPDLAEDMRAQLLEALEQQGRYVDLAVYLERELAPELDGEVAREDLHPARANLLGKFAEVHREFLHDETKAARIYERMERLGHLPDEGLASLARFYRVQQRHQDLVRILTLRSHALDETGETDRKAEVDQRIAELLEGPLGRPHEAAHFWLDAYLADPGSNRLAGARARLLLAGTDAVVNVKQKLHDRYDRTPEQHQPALLSLLADILAPHEEHEEEAERTYQKALEQEAGFGPAQEGLGRLLARQGRLEDAVGPLEAAARNDQLDPHRAAENAAIAARALHELDRPVDAEALLRAALDRAPDAQRALLELSRLYHRLGRPHDEAAVLDDLSELPLSAMLKAEVSYRRAMLLEPEFATDAMSVMAERARAHLLEAVSADANHVAARQVLLELARGRNEWSTVAHMYYLAIRELAPGPQRALVHLDLAETYLLRLGDVESALRNIESAIQQAPDDVVVADRTARMAEAMPDPARAAERFEHIAGGDNELDDAARARLWLLAADLRMREDDVAGAEMASQNVLALERPPGDVANAATRRLKHLAGADDRELRHQRAGLIRLLEQEEQPAERLHILSRLRDVARALGEDDLVEKVSLEQLELAHDLAGSEDDRDAAVRTLRELFAERGDYTRVVKLYENLASQIEDPKRAAETLGDAARFALHGLKDPKTAVGIVRRALTLHPQSGAPDLVAELATLADERTLPHIFQELRQIPEEQRTADVCLQLSDLARRLGQHQLSADFLQETLDRDPSPHQALHALVRLSTALSQTGAIRDQIPVLERGLELASEHAPERTAELSLQLAEALQRVGAFDRAELICAEALEKNPEDKGILRLHAELLEQREDWGNLIPALVELSELSLEDRERALWLTRAARVHLDHPELSANHRAAIDNARKLLLRAREVAPRAGEARAALLPLSFTERRWEEVSQVAGELRGLEGEDHESLVLAALTEALQQGVSDLATTIANRHDANVRQRLLWPGVRHVLADVAARGPLPRLDAVLAAAASVCGGGGRMMQELQAWAVGQPLHPGLSLALARLYEATGDGTMARHMYQIAAFMAPRGPVERLVERLPQPPIPADPLSEPGWSSLEDRGALRSVLIRLRNQLAGIRGKRAGIRQPATDGERELLRTAGAIITPWRASLRVALPLTFADDVGHDGVAIRNEAEPCIALGPQAEGLSDGEFRFRLARAVAGITMGLAVVRDPFGAELVDVLDALGQIVNPTHRPSGLFAQAIADAVATVTSAGVVEPELRSALAEELVHWMSNPAALARLGVVMARAETLLATRLSGRLDGALRTIARERGLPLEHGHSDAESLLRHDEAHWLLRGLGLY